MLCVALGYVFLRRQQFEAAQTHFQHGLARSQRDGSPYPEARCQRGLGLVYLQTGRLAEAARQFETAYRLLKSMGKPPGFVDCLTNLVQVELAQKKGTQLSQNGLDLLTNIQTDRLLTGSDQPLLAYLTCYRMLTTCQDERASEILQTAHTLLHSWVDELEGEEAKRMFVESIAEHRQIQSLWKASLSHLALQ